ncbi:MAG TPA: hypothetical protein VKR31_17720, partial [Rhizomicrobium sp.]|nr:hypothetical protein [Rhizomicrobium sp.]
RLRPGFLFLQNPDNLLFRKSSPLHRPYPFPGPDSNSKTGGVLRAQVNSNIERDADQVPDPT